MIVTITDIRLAGHCVKGAKAWFHAVGLGDRFREFLADGLPAEVLLETGDGLAEQVVNAKIAREASNG